MERAGVQCEVVFTERPGHAAEIVRQRADGYDAIFTLGGDGTAMEVAGALAGTPCPLGVLAGGTGNLLARAVGIPLDPKAAVPLLLRGEELLDPVVVGRIVRHVQAADLARMRLAASRTAVTMFW